MPSIVHKAAADEEGSNGNSDGVSNKEEKKASKTNTDASSSSSSSSSSHARKPDAVADAERQWADRYGALILFFERHGHSNVPPDHPLVDWACRQRIRLTSLSERRVKQLRMLDFWFSRERREPDARVAHRCVDDDCEKFAAFERRCHEHYFESLAIATTTTTTTQNNGKRNSSDAPEDEGGGSSGTEHENSDNIAKEAKTTANNSWAERYGALILFFEKAGHADVAPDDRRADPALRRWVARQRAEHPELSEQRTKQLRLLNFRFPGVPHSPVDVERCSRGACKKWAAFGGFCHGHYYCSSSSAPTTDVDERPLDRQPGRLSGGPKREFPLVGLKRRKNKNYDVGSRSDPDNISRDIPRQEVINRITPFVKELSKHTCSNSSEKRISTTCECMSFLNDKPYIIESISHAIMDYYDMKPLRRKHYSVERFRYANRARRKHHNHKDGPQRTFSLPLSYEYFERHPLPSASEMDDDDGDGDGGVSEGNVDKQDIIGQAFRHSICAHAFHNLHHIGSTSRKTLNKYAGGDISVGVHGNLGKSWTGEKKYVQAYESLRDMLNMITEEFREHENEKGKIILPVEISRRKTFVRWCHDRGWNVKKLHKSKTQRAQTDEWNVRPGFFRTEEEAIENGGDGRNVAKVVFSWTAFMTFWKAEFPHLISQGWSGKTDSMINGD